VIERFVWTEHAERRCKRRSLGSSACGIYEATILGSILTDMRPTDILSYDPDADIAMICVEEGRAASEEHSWGLIDRDRDTGRLMGFEIWRASTILPAELIKALRAADKHRGGAAA
jgi:uncharacterized protein YuzE